MNTKLLIEAITKYISGLLIVLLLLFLPAFSLKYWNAWLLIGLLFIPMLVAGIILLIINPALLAKRLNNKEENKEQKIVIILSAFMFVAGFIIASLNYRFNWINLPNIVIYICSAIFFISYILYGEVLRENTYLERTIKVSKNQKIIDTGMYGIVRHPMYLITIFLFLSMPLILGSIISFIIFLIYPGLIVIRIINEEKVLVKELPGYLDYQKKVKYRLIPFIW